MIGLGHPLAHTASTDPDTLLDYPVILPMRGTYTRELVEQAFADACPDSVLQVKLATNNLETIKMMVSIGLGWSVLPQTLLDNELQTLQLPQLKLERQLGVVWHAGRTLSNAARSMLECLQQNADPG